MENSNAPTPMSAGLANREKFWSELDSDTKIERMRSVLKNLVNKVERMENLGYKTRKLLLRHSHTEDGKVVQVITELETDSCDSPRGRIGDKEGDNVYI